MTSEDIKISEWNRQTLGFSVSALGDALSTSSRDGYRLLSNVNKAQRYITEFLGEVHPLPKLSEGEANLSSSLHTYMRKNMDGHLSVILYRLISESRGLNTWNAFIKGVNSAKKNKFQEGLELAERTSRDIGTTDETFMCSALHLWKKHEDGENDLEYVLTEWIGK
jgi:hypothetical protein